MDKLKVLWAQLKANLPDVITGYPVSSVALLLIGAFAVVLVQWLF